MAYFNHDGFPIDPFSGAISSVKKALHVTELLWNDAAAKVLFSHPALGTCQASVSTVNNKINAL